MSSDGVAVGDEIGTVRRSARYGPLGGLIVMMSSGERLMDIGRARCGSQWHDKAGVQSYLKNVGIHLKCRLGGYNGC